MNKTKFFWFTSWSLNSSLNRKKFPTKVSLLTQLKVKTEIKNLFHNCLGRKHLFETRKKHSIKNNTQDWENYNNYCEEDFSIWCQKKSRLEKTHLTPHWISIKKQINSIELHKNTHINLAHKSYSSPRLGSNSVSVNDRLLCDVLFTIRNESFLLNS